MTTTNDALDLPAIDAAAKAALERANAATAGPWYADSDRRMVTTTRPGDEPTWRDDLTGEYRPDGEEAEQSERDNRFIAAARSDVPALGAHVLALLARVRESEAEAQRLREALEWFADEGHYTDTYRLGAGYVDALGLERARAAIAAKEAGQ